MPNSAASLKKVGALLKQARQLAVEYRNLTGRPLGITGEVAEYEAARLLRLGLAKVRQAGHDVLRVSKGKSERLQVKGRCILNKKLGQRVGSIDTTNKEWDGVLLVLLDANFEPIEIHEASRAKIVAELKKPGSKSRNVRGALSVSQFKRVSTQVWPHSK